ncbi:MAG TPA: sensor histidine kinase [Ruminiclostridium sp.]|nr:sensor histidine kinase [Ruminiclostridium sp.]
MKLLNCLKIRIKEMSLRTSIMIIMSLIIILAVFSSNYLLMGYSNKFIYLLSNNYIQSAISQSVSRINSDLFDSVYEFSSLIMKDEDVQNVLTKDVSDPQSEDAQVNKVLFGEKIRRKYVAGIEKIKIVALIGRNGQIYSVSFSDQFGGDTLNEFRNMVKVCKKTSVAFWSPLRECSSTNSISDDVRNEYSIWIYRALRDPTTGRYMGMGVFSVSEKEIFDMYNSSRISNLTQTTVFTGNGEMVSSTDFNGRVKLDGDQAQELIAKGVENNTVVSNGEKYLVVTNPLKINDWYISNKIPISDIYREASKLMFYGLVIIIIFIFISFLLVNELSKRIVKPLKNIIKAMERTEQGDFSTQVELTGQHEVYQLGRYFNNMVSKISDMILVEYELERKKKEAEMNVLMSQINPHFLYNTLESIVWKSQIAGETEIGEMAAALGDIYRISVNKGNPLVSISDEIKHVKAYSYIQKIRYKDNFNFEYWVEDEELLKLYTIKMLLQPMVENSIVHGLNPLSHSLEVRVEVKRRGGDIELLIRDNGRGLEEESISSLMDELRSSNVLKTIEIHTQQKRYRGIGLRNTNERIKLYFGDEYGLKIESEPEAGTCIRIIIPTIKDIPSDFRQ